MDLTTRLVVPPQVMSRLVGSETVLLDLATGIYFGLDNVGQLIWESVSNGKSLGEAAGSVIEQYDVDNDVAESDVLAFAAQLVERGLLSE